MLHVLAIISSYKSVSYTHLIMGVGPVASTKKALAKVNMTIDDMDLSLIHIQMCIRDSNIYFEYAMDVPRYFEILEFWGMLA